MAEILATWDDFSGGHWGAAGPRNAEKNQYGGVNMLVSRQGGLIHASASRWLQLNAAPLGRVWGMFWAWGADGRVYYVQQAAASTVTSNVYRFTPNASSLPNTLSTTSTFTWVPTTDPDWVCLDTTVYVTFYANKTYKINTDTNVMNILTGSFGNAPAGRAICLWGENLVVGGISDARYGVHPNRIVFSGDYTDPVDTTDLTSWEDLAFYDIGSTNSFITGLYPIRDFLLVVTDDQQVYVITGTPGTGDAVGTVTIRRVYGFHKGSGGLTAFLPRHGAIDPAQTRIWMYDHSIRGPVRHNGATMTRVPAFGVAHADREGDDLIEGAMAMIGGPDEFIMHGVALPRAGGKGVDGHKLELVRLAGRWAVIQNDNLAARS